VRFLRGALAAGVIARSGVPVDVHVIDSSGMPRTKSPAEYRADGAAPSLESLPSCDDLPNSP
jgi:hypothetical protein